MTGKVYIITEADERVATGHLLECIEIADALEAEGIRTKIFINQDADDSLKGRIRTDFAEYRCGLEDTADGLFTEGFPSCNDVVVFDMRQVSNEVLLALKGKTKAGIICIDEFGGRRLDCDVIINPMIDDSYWHYEGEAKVFAGAEYLVLQKGIVSYGSMPKITGKEISRICISMGGVDRFGTTLKLADWVVREEREICFDVIIGGGFAYRTQLENALKGRTNCRILQNVSHIYEIFYHADLAFCAGGNTLHELACIGVPAITIPTAPHESRNGRAFERMGFGACLPMAEELCEEDVDCCMGKMRDFGVRKAMSEKGKQIAKGEGLVKTRGIIMGELEKKGLRQ